MQGDMGNKGDGKDRGREKKEDFLEKSAD